MESEEVRASGPVEEPVSSVMPVMPAELRLEMPVRMEMQVMPAERKVEREYEVRLRISGGEMKGITEAPHYMENQNDPVLKESSSRCIYRVPKRLRQGNEKAYTPQVVSIGPLHHGEEHLKAMEEHKKRYLQHFLRRTGVGFSDYIQMIKEQEGRLRGSYAESIEFGSDQFAGIVLVDAAFVIGLLLRYHYFIQHEGEDDYGQVEDDYIFNNPRMLWDVRPDLRLLENQLPFFILQDLFNIASSSLPQPPSLLEISHLFFENEIDGEGKEKNFDKILSSGEVQHFVDLIISLYRLPEPVKKPKTRDTRCVCGFRFPCHTPNITATPNVTELHQAGVKFKVGKGSSLFDIKFSHGILKIYGILEIPKLKVDDTKELTLRNLLAFEQCHRRECHCHRTECNCHRTECHLRKCHCHRRECHRRECYHREADYLADYVFLMKRLVKTPEDVQLLVDNGIIDNWLGDAEKISTLLHNLGTGMMVDPRSYAPLCGELIDYRRKCWRGSMVNLKQKYFKTPWSTMSLFAAIILLLLTAIQTACSYKSAPLL